MSNEMKKGRRKARRRPYRQKERARQQEETRRRITEALVQLHRTVGPARTTVSEVAEMAGVGRMTVYNNFPTERDLIHACSSHWAARNPFPDHAVWRRIDDPERRLRVALEEMYAWYRGTQDMVANVLRDSAIVPPLREVMDQAWWPVIGAMVESLAAGRRLRGERGRRVRAALRLALDFATWRTLTGAGVEDRPTGDDAAGRDSGRAGDVEAHAAGLDDRSAAALAAKMVGVAGRATN